MISIRLDLGFAGGVRASSGLQFLPNDKDNLAVAAALAFRKATGQTWRDLLITIEKRIPVCAGTAGGSSDAAAVLRGLNELTDAGLSPQALAKSARKSAPMSLTVSWAPPPWREAGGRH